MNQKILFFMLSGWSLLSFSSQHKERIQDAQHFRKEAVFFSLITHTILTNNVLVGQATRSRLMLTCHPDNGQTIDPDKLQLVQNNLGFLYAICAHEQQKLGHFPTQRLNLDEVSLSIYEHPELKMIFEIPCQEVIIKPPF